MPSVRAPARPGRQTYKNAKRALDANGERERKAGVDWETEEYYRPNDAVIEAEKNPNLPWWRR